MWIGLHSLDNKTTWKYTDGTPFDYNPWLAGFPSGTPQQSDCGYLGYAADGMRNMGCWLQFQKSICKFPM